MPEPRVPVIRPENQRRTAMKANTFALLVEAIESIMNEENEERSQIVYPQLSEDMATAARQVYDACLRGQEYAESASVTV
jgi:hypothetical protein